MAEQTIILIERKEKTHFAIFIELFKNRIEVPFREVRKKIPNSSYYEFTLNKIHTLNKTIKLLDPEHEAFITPSINDDNGKIIQTFKRNRKLEIIDDDPNFFYLKLKTNTEEVK